MQGEFLVDCSPLDKLVLLVNFPLCNLALLVNFSLGDLVLLIIVQLALPLQSTLNVNLEIVSITVISNGCKFKCTIALELYFTSSRTACDSWPLYLPLCLQPCLLALLVNQRHHLLGARFLTLSPLPLPQQILL